MLFCAFVEPPEPDGASVGPHSLPPGPIHAQVHDDLQLDSLHGGVNHRGQQLRFHGSSPNSGQKE